VRAQGRAQKLHVRGIGQQTVLHALGLTPRGLHAEPQAVVIVQHLRFEQVLRLDLADFDGPRPQEISAPVLGYPFGQRRTQLGLAGHAVGARNAGHVVLVGPAVFGFVERRGKVQDLLAMLDSHHPAGGEAAPIAALVHVVDDGSPGVSGAQEISVQ